MLHIQSTCWIMSFQRGAQNVRGYGRETPRMCATEAPTTVRTSGVRSQADRMNQRFPHGGRDETKLQRHVVTIDSRSRVNPESTTPSEYTIQFPMIGQVKKMRLISTEIPNSQYVINTSNNIIDFIDVGGGRSPVAIAIVPGSYTATELANQLNTQINAEVGVGFGIQFVVTYITFTKKFIIERIVGGTFSLLFATGNNSETSAGHELGYTVDLLGVTVATSDATVDLGGENYAFLQLDGYPALTTTENIENVFAKIIWNVPPAFITYDSFAANDYVLQHPRDIRDLRVRFSRQDANLYEFNNLEHSFSIELYSIVQT